MDGVRASLGTDDDSDVEGEELGVMRVFNFSFWK